jgi:hypothetical protein
VAVSYPFIIADFELVIPNSGGFLSGVLLGGFGLTFGGALIGRAIDHSPVLRRLGLRIVMWHVLVLLFTVLWLLPYYADRTDAIRYHFEGQEIANLVRAGLWGQIYWTLGTRAMSNIVGLFYVPFGSNLYAMYLISALIGIAAVLYFFRAFALFQPTRSAKAYALLLFFLPSFSVWSCILGKDSLAALGLALISYGYAIWLKGCHGRAMAHIVVGLVVVGVVRPHMALIGLIGAFLVEIICRGAAVRGTVLGKIIRVVAVSAMLYLLGPLTQDFVGLDENTATAALGRMDISTQGNQYGGSAVETPTISTPLQMALFFPSGVVRVLFRPFPWEANNFNAALAALENLFIAYLVLRRLRHLPGLFVGIRGRPYSCYCLIVAFELLVILGPTPNLGLLSRERTQLLPFFFAFLLTGHSMPQSRRRFGNVWAPGSHPPAKTLVPFESPERGHAVPTL